MALAKKTVTDVPAEVASRISAALQQERVVPRFVDSYVVEHGRYALQVHASLYRDLLTLLQREALLAATARALEISTLAPQTSAKQKARLIPRKDATIFRRKYLAALTRLQKWTAGDALDFQNDLQVYEELLLRVGAARRRRKPFEAANHPFVDRCAFLLDSSFMEKARLAASRTLADVDELAEHAFAAAAQAAKRSPAD
jgi:type II secretory pathway pseudopilin PulG